jgi:trimeric autotransporter adhesin
MRYLLTLLALAASLTACVAVTNTNTFVRIDNTGRFVGAATNVPTANALATTTQASNITAAAMALALTNSASYTNALAIGRGAVATGDMNERNGVALGYNATASALGAVTIGASGYADSTAIDAVTIGRGATNSSWAGVALGNHAYIGDGAFNVAVGRLTLATGFHAIAIGYKAEARANAAVQIGQGTNSTATSLQFRDVPVVAAGQIATVGFTGTTNIGGIALTFTNGVLKSVIP